MRGGVFADPIDEHQTSRTVGEDERSRPSSSIELPREPAFSIPPTIKKYIIQAGLFPFVSLRFRILIGGSKKKLGKSASRVPSSLKLARTLRVHVLSFALNCPSPRCGASLPVDGGKVDWKDEGGGYVDKEYGYMIPSRAVV